MGAHFIRPAVPLEAIHATDPEFKATVEQWISDAGESPEAAEDFFALVADQEQKPWVVRSKDSATIGIVRAGKFLKDFEDVTDTDVLNDIYRERVRHGELGYNWAHDDVHGLTHLVQEVSHRMQSMQSTLYSTDADKRKELVQAASIIVAAIDKIDRAQTTRTFSVD